MDCTLESKACVACAKAKRKCGKQIPSCSRCASRGFRCAYSQALNNFSLPPRQDRSAETVTQIAGAETFGPAPHAAAVLDISVAMPEELSALDGLLDMDFDYAFTALSSPTEILNLNPKSLSVPWYMESASWEIENAPHAEVVNPFCNSVFLKHIEQVQEVHARWVKTGSNTYIHKFLYKHHMPRCIQDAYTLLATYLSATPENKQIVLHLFEERLKSLLQDQPDEAPVQDPNKAPKTTTNITASTQNPSQRSSLTVFEHLARVQALHIYQTIGLFDGNIRARHIAETQIPTLNAWMRAMMAAAKSTAALGVEPFARTLLSEPPTDVPLALSPDDTAWIAWVLSESVRRTWMVAAATQSVFLALQVKWAPCPGSARLHTRAGLWGAESAFAWKRGCEELARGARDGVDFVDRRGWERVFECRRFEEVDEFLRCTLEITFGSERMERWEAESASG